MLELRGYAPFDSDTLRADVAFASSRVQVLKDQTCHPTEILRVQLIQSLHASAQLVALYNAWRAKRLA